MLKSLLGFARQWDREKLAILTLKPRSHVKIVICRTWAIFPLSLVTIPESQFGQGSKVVNDLIKDSSPVFVCWSSFFLSRFLQDAKQ